MIIHRFGIPQSITIDQGLIFSGGRIREFAKDYGLKIVNSTPYYA